MTCTELYSKYVERIENIQLKSLDLINNCDKTNKELIDGVEKSCVEILLNVYEEIVYVYISFDRNYDYDRFRDYVDALQKDNIKNLKNSYPDKFAKYTMLNEYLNRY